MSPSSCLHGWGKDRDHILQPALVGWRSVGHSCEQDKQNLALAGEELSGTGNGRGLIIIRIIVKIGEV